MPVVALGGMVVVAHENRPSEDREERVLNTFRVRASDFGTAQTFVSTMMPSTVVTFSRMTLTAFILWRIMP
jgi:hypothetical protein